MTVRAWMDRQGKRFVYGSGEIRDGAGALLARGQARLVPLTRKLEAQFIGAKGKAATGKVAAQRTQKSKAGRKKSARPHSRTR